MRLLLEAALERHGEKGVVAMLEQEDDDGNTPLGKLNLKRLNDKHSIHDFQIEGETYARKKKTRS